MKKKIFVISNFHISRARINVKKEQEVEVHRLVWEGVRKKIVPEVDKMQRSWMINVVNGQAGLMDANGVAARSKENQKVEICKTSHGKERKQKKKKEIADYCQWVE